LKSNIIDYNIVQWYLNPRACIGLQFAENHNENYINASNHNGSLFQLSMPSHGCSH